MSALAAAQATQEALERLLATLDRLGLKGGALPTVPAVGPASSSGSDTDRVRAEWRQRLQDPQEIEALKRRLGLR
jgi:hypothetical protein